MTASLGALLARRLKAPLYLDIRDIFVDTMKDVLPGKLAWASKPFLSALERWTLGTARRVNLVSPGFLPYFQARYPGRDWSLFSNGIDDEFLAAAPPDAEQPAGERVLDVVYAGNMGEGQGLHAILPGLARHFRGRLHFRLVGDGGRRAQLEQALADAGCDNVTLLDPVNREALIGLYQSADVLFLHLNDYPAFKKVLPSKLFEYAALDKPVWAGVGGYAPNEMARLPKSQRCHQKRSCAAARRSFPMLVPQAMSAQIDHETQRPIALVSLFFTPCMLMIQGRMEVRKIAGGEGRRRKLERLAAKTREQSAVGGVVTS